jgi:DNA-binding NtrC family response regulator
VGTRVEILLPATVSDSAALSLSRECLLQGDEKILVIDDEEMFSSILARMLNTLGYRVTKVKSSREALSVFKEYHQEIDLVITDWAMPDITGDRLSTLMHKVAPGVKVILCSAFEAGTDLKSMERYGIHATLKKPVAIEELARVVRMVLDKAE